MSVRRAMSVAFVLSLLATSGASAAVPGVTSLTHRLDAGQLDTLRDTGSKSALFYLSWRDFQPNDATMAPNFVQEYSDLITGLRARGITPNFVVFNAPNWATRPTGTGNEGFPPISAEEQDRYANFVRDLASLPGFKGKVGRYEIWNEVDDDLDAGTFWKQPRAERPATYAALVNKAGKAIKQADPQAKVSLAPFVANDVVWLDQLYKAGIDKSAYDIIGVHVDTACLTVGPYDFYREPSGVIGRYTFLGYREVRRLALANGDPKPMHMEMGWSTYTGTCERGSKSGQKPSGVSVDSATAFVQQGFSCIAEDPYMETAEWFALADTAPEPIAGGRELAAYGLFGPDFKPKQPLLDAFKAVAAAPNGDLRTEACGDFEPPRITVNKPVPNQQFVDKLDIEAFANDSGVGFDSDGVSAGRATFAFDGGQEIRNFTGAAFGQGKLLQLLPWQGSGRLAVGKHTIEVIAIDRNGNVGKVVVPVEKVGKLAATLTPRFRLGKVRCSKKRRCTLGGSLLKTGGSTESLGGKVRIVWQVKRRGVWRKQSGGLKPANKPFTFVLKKAKFKGSWRARVSYEGLAPWRSLKPRTVSFRVR